MFEVATRDWSGDQTSSGLFFAVPLFLSEQRLNFRLPEGGKNMAVDTGMT